MSQVNTTHSQKPTREDVPNDDDYFASLDPEQIKWYEEYGPEISSFNVESTVNCTSCNKPVQIQVFCIRDAASCQGRYLLHCLISINIQLQIYRSAQLMESEDILFWE